MLVYNIFKYPFGFSKIKKNIRGSRFYTEVGNSCGCQRSFSYVVAMGKAELLYCKGFGLRTKPHSKLNFDEIRRNGLFYPTFRGSFVIAK